MGRTIGSVLIIANTGKREARGLAEEIEEYLRGEGIKTTLFAYDGTPVTDPPDKRFDLAISLGGDGTVLFASRILSSHTVPILPVNLGIFGFITEVTREEWRDAFLKFRDGKIDAGKRLILEVSVYRRDSAISSFVGLNDAVISAGGISKIVNLTVHLGDQFLGHYRADGMIIATPTGSTAYSAAAGGPILHPEMEAMILNPICPHTLSHRPLVIPADEVVNIEIAERQRTNVVLTVDGQSLTPLEPFDRVVIRQMAERAAIVRSHRRTFYEVLRTKLNWSGGPG
ncbi:MAG: NAD(+)/NADH kinase, partial [Alkalispirochaetaceae bacterium]